MGGWWKKVLRVDLDRGTCRVEELPQDSLTAVIGGRGLGALIVSREVPVDVDPGGPGNRIVIATGPLTGTKAPTAGRCSLSTVSPLTGAIHDSNAGGRLGVNIKRCGYDAIVIQGRASAPTALVLANEQAELVEAAPAWGRDTTEVTGWLRGLTGTGGGTVCIGPAGVSGVRISAAVVDGRRAFARGGVGAVFSAKNLIGIAARGDLPVDVHDHDRFDFARYEASKLLDSHPITSRALPRFGTAVLVNLMNECGVLPANNFRQSVFVAAHRVSGEALRRLLSGRSACWGCATACGRVIEWRGAKHEGPEYESLWALGPNCGIGNLDTIIAANLACNRLGLDTISTGSVIACAMEMGEGVSFGDEVKMLELIDRIAARDGVGGDLAEGALSFARTRRAEHLAMHSRGLELPAYDPRGMKGQGLALATSNRGGCHLRANMLGPEIVGAPKMVDRFEHRGRAGLVIVMQHSHAVADSLVTCKFANFALGDEHWARLLTAATGVDYSTQDLQVAGERIWHLERIFNLRRGGMVAVDSLPGRLTDTPVTEGPATGSVVELDEMLAEYYRFRGWDGSGTPAPARLDRLGIRTEVD